MEKRLNDLIDRSAMDMIVTTQKLLQIESVYSRSTHLNEPFGPGPAKALDFMIKTAESMGFTCKNVQGYAGYIEMGKGEELIGVLSHLDVVPAGAGWSVPPFSGEIKDNCIYGRGAVDDKGPTIATLYALKAIRDSRLPVSKRVRHIMGLNEEEGFRCIRYYLDHEEVPSMGFSPDGDFPVIHGEKGILQFTATDHYKVGRSLDMVLQEIRGGTAPNVVPGEAYAVFHVNMEGRFQLEKAYRYLKDKRHISLEDNKYVITVTATGKSAHGSRPDLGDNALSHLLAFLLTVSGMDAAVKKTIRKFYTLFGKGYDGKGAGAACSDELSGPLTMNLGEFVMKDGTATANMDVRYPVTKDFALLWHDIEEAVEAQDLDLHITEHKKPLYVPKDHPLVEKLCSVYREMTKDKTKPLVIGGGTYCRALENFVAFGPMFPGRPDTVHQADEHIAIPDLVLMAKIYAQAIYELIK